MKVICKYQGLCDVWFAPIQYATVSLAKGTVCVKHIFLWLCDEGSLAIVIWFVNLFSFTRGFQNTDFYILKIQNFSEYVQNTDFKVKIQDMFCIYWTVGISVLICFNECFPLLFFYKCTANQSVTHIIQFIHCFHSRVDYLANWGKYWTYFWPSCLYRDMYRIVRVYRDMYRIVRFCIVAPLCTSRTSF